MGMDTAIALGISESLLWENAGILPKTMVQIP